jgi:hypothetical protein
VQTVEQKFGDIAAFDSELKYVEKAASGKNFSTVMELNCAGSHDFLAFCYEVLLITLPISGKLAPVYTLIL